MAKLKKEDLNQLNDADLKQRLHDDAERLVKLRFNHAVNPIDNPAQLRYVRREIARLNTEMRKRELVSANK